MDKKFKIAFVLSAIDKATAVINRAMSNAEKHAKSLEKASKGVGEIADKSLIAGGVMTAFFGKATQDARESEKATRRLATAYKNAGDQAGTAAAKAAEFAGDLQMKIGVEDEEIMAVESKLAVFGSLFKKQAVNAQLLSRATKTAYDMEADGFGEASGNAVKIGKALEDPIKGITALSKAGIRFNDTEKAKLKHLVETNRKFEAQQYVINKLEKKFKGIAEATADPVKIMQREFSETSEALGRQLLPMVMKYARKIADAMPKIMEWIDKHGNLIRNVAKLGVGLLAFGGVMKILSFSLSGVSTAFTIFSKSLQLTKGILGFGRAALVAGSNISKLQKIGLGFNSFLLRLGPLASSAGTAIASFGASMSKFFSSLGPLISTASKAIVRFGITLLASPITWYIAAGVALGAAVYFIIKNWSKISAFFARLWAGVKSVFMKFVGWAKTLFLNFTAVGLVIKYWTPLTKMFGNIWNSVKGVFLRAWQWIVNLGSKFYDAGKNIINSVWRGMKDMAMKPVQMIADIAKKIRAHLPFSPAKTGALRDIHRVKLIETIAQGVKAKPLLDAFSNVTARLYGQMNQPAAVQAAGGGGAQIHFNPVIHLSGGATEADAKKVSNTMKDEFKKMMREYERNKDRVKF